MQSPTAGFQWCFVIVHACFPILFPYDIIVINIKFWIGGSWCFWNAAHSILFYFIVLFVKLEVDACFPILLVYMPSFQYCSFIFESVSVGHVYNLICNESQMVWISWLREWFLHPIICVFLVAWILKCTLMGNLRLCFFAFAF